MKTALALLALLPALLAPLPAGALPEGPAAGGAAAGPEAKPGTFPAVEEVKDEEAAKALVKALEDAVETKEEGKIAAAAEAMVAKRHKAFVAPLKKLLADRRDAVAAAAAAALGSQGDKGVAKLLTAVVTQEVRERGWLQRSGVKAAAIESLGRLGVDGAGGPILKLAETMAREPDLRATYAPPLLRAAVRYFGLVKMKTAVSFLIEHVDEPAPADVTSGTNPPAEYWKARHEAWMFIRGEVRWALKEITGREMETGRRWRSWLDEEGKKQGMK